MPAISQHNYLVQPITKNSFSKYLNSVPKVTAILKCHQIDRATYYAMNPGVATKYHQIISRQVDELCSC